jgi:hypothetical protein
MGRAARWERMWDQAQLNMTATQLRKPIKYQTWTKSQASQAVQPAIFSRPMWATAAARPIVARFPLST